MTDNVGARPSDQALVSDGAATHLYPSGFDPSRIADAMEAVEPTLLQPIIRKAAEEFYCAVLGTAEDWLRDNMEGNLKSHLAMLERENQRMRTELYEVDSIIGPPWLTQETRLQRLREMDRAAAALIELRYAVEFDPKRAAAIATEARRAETLGSVEDEGADPKGIAR